MLKSYQEAIDYLYANLPIFQRVGSVAFRPSLANTIHLCEALGNPQHKFKSIHVGGTNGKGSTSHMLASVLQEAGYKTGLYTSPHLKDFSERIRINGEEISKDFVIDFVNCVKPVIEEIKPSFFEITVVMAFDYYAQNNVDVAVIEVGLGGRLDSTNVITPVLSVITNIGWDHMDLLGDTLEKIASEKAGIIKNHVPVVISERQSSVENVFTLKAQEEVAPIHFASDDIKVEEKYADGTLMFTVYKNGNTLFENIVLPLQGTYQRKNLPGILESIEVLTSHGFVISEENIKQGLLRVITNTKLKGRWQKLGDKPLMICDTGHNIDGIQEVVKQIRQQKFATLHFVLGMVKDKDISKVLSLLPKEAHYYFCQADIPRALDAFMLSEKAKEFDLTGQVIPKVSDAIAAAKRTAKPDDFIFIGGSTFVVAEIENL
ncbi:MAG TPA: folylpolyglutamate synthase/dihydrofolate synthase family protein [Cyclobacteriaceae bacterium]|nr:folylpolyglutamate synthase/dihydrofolate synthase family protein [Cyclobacteriaceae bacterium]